MNIDTNSTYSTPPLGHDYVTGEAAWLYKKQKFSWQPVVAGIATALAVQVILSLIGAGIGYGVEARNPGAFAQPKPAIGALMWAGVSLLVSAFYGGFIAARLAKTASHHEGILNGIVAWAGSVLVVLFLLSNSYGHMFGGASQVMGPVNGPHYGRYAPGPGPHIAPPPPAPGSAEMLNRQELNNPPPIDQARIAEDEAAASKAALAAGVVMVLAMLVSAIGGSLGAAHVRHDRARQVLTAKNL